MWTKNAVNYQKIISLVAQKNSSDYIVFPSALTLKDTTGTLRTQAKPSGSSTPRGILQSTVHNGLILPTGEYFMSSDCNTGIVFGSGTTPATEDDYTLESPLKSGFTYITNSKTDAYSEDGNTRTSAVSFSVRNNSGSEKTISEIGMLQEFKEGSSINQIYMYLVFREVLATPVVVQNSGIFTINITAEFHV